MNCRVEVFEGGGGVLSFGLKIGGILKFGPNPCKVLTNFWPAVPLPSYKFWMVPKMTQEPAGLDCNNILWHARQAWFPYFGTQLDTRNVRNNVWNVWLMVPSLRQGLRIQCFLEGQFHNVLEPYPLSKLMSHSVSSVLVALRAPSPICFVL